MQWASSAYKHRITQARTRYIIQTYQPALIQPPRPPDRPDEQIVYLGDDRNGTALEVMTVAPGQR